PTAPADAPLAASLHDKRQILLQHLLKEAAEAQDIPLDSPAVPIRELAFESITDQEVERAIFKGGSTAPGEDEIPSLVIKAGWELLKTPVTRLYRSCIAAGHHPACFKTAVVVILPKPNKADKSSHKSYRPIALLSVLGKGLERLVAKRMSWLVISSRVLSPQQFGALPLRSATDLTTCLTHDIEEALNRRLTASLLTLDVKGAFNAVLPGCLVRRLREQGWPPHICAWVASFATGRQVRIRLDGQIGPAEHL
ncbi:hypothetical protein K3495_g16670, partial [Podosphaera aphanis]